MFYSNLDFITVEGNLILTAIYHDCVHGINLNDNKTGLDQESVGDGGITYLKIGLVLAFQEARGI